jgi:hypothetical protein
MENSDRYLEELEGVSGEVLGATCRAKALAYIIRRGGSGGAVTTSRPLLQRLNDFDNGKVLVDVPPAALPIPCKPAFYDIAWRYASAFPEDEIQNFIDEHEKQQSKGLLGWFRG